MERLKDASLRKSFILIVLFSLLVACALSAVVYLAGDIVIDLFHLHEMEPVDGILTAQQQGVTGYYEQVIQPWYGIVRCLQIAIPFVLCISSLVYADMVYYRLKLKKPIAILTESAERIQRQELDFEIAEAAHDELGELCNAFEIMRQTLLTNNRELWRQTEERKRLNAAFAHDLRNPVTVLKGSAKLLQKSISQKTLTPDSAKEPVKLICQYTQRIADYIELMASAQRLEELECRRQVCDTKRIQSELQNSLSVLAEASGKSLDITCSGTVSQIQIDKQFVFNTAENLVGNALRYANTFVSVEISCQAGKMLLCVTDDGNGYPDTVLKNGVAPFLKNGEANDEHFGMGLYICKLLCEKHNGGLRLENLEHGAKATAIFEF